MLLLSGYYARINQHKSFFCDDCNHFPKILLRREVVIILIA
jgi:hypothetical protein